MEQNTKNLFRWVGRLVKVLAFTVLVPVAIVMLDLAAMFFSTPIPDTHTELTNLADDTTFYVGRETTSNREAGGYLSVRAIGEVDGPGALILVEYLSHPAVMVRCELPNGKVNQVWHGDFYETRAKISFLHNGARSGKLKLDIVFSLPPEEWKPRNAALK
ncbi:hypothetical protein WBJ53_22010 [Spirosoma sp. SC4-14]|uniref:hypothetical protein n=1 Tax=Spirosoma sp. SC4-14 TaxID=3128900 RepID=UPI0030D1668E